MKAIINYEPLKLRQRTVKLTKQVKYFTDIAELNPIPTNTIIDKVLPGLGATYSELVSARNSILILPNVSTIKGKHGKHKGGQYPTFAVYEDVKTKDLKKYLDSTSTYKKIITTPEGFISKVKPVLKEAMYSDYFLLLDECHKFTTDSGYRAEIILPLDDFFKFNNKAMVSSTVVLSTDSRFKANGFTLCKLKPNYDITVPIQVEETNNVQEHLIRSLKEVKDERCFIFFNSLHGIKSIIEKLQKAIPDDKLDYKIFCSKFGADELRIAGFSNSQDFYDSSAKYNFLTSSFFNGLDIDFEGHEAKVYMLTDIDFAPHSALNVETDVIQIRGRFRKYLKDNVQIDWVKEFTHIFKPDTQAICLTRPEAIEKINISQQVYQYLQLFPGLTSNRLTLDVVGGLLKTVYPYASLINVDGTLNQFKVDNYLLKEQVISLYKGSDELLEAYSKAGRHSVTFNTIKYKLRNIDKLKYSDGKYSVETYIDVTNILWECEANPNDSWSVANRLNLEQRYPLIVKAYDTLHIDIMNQLGFDHSLIKRCLIYAESLIGINKFPVLSDVYASFNINKVYLWSEIKPKLQNIYDTHEVPKIADATDINEYFETKLVWPTRNKKRHRAFRILRKLKSDIYDRN